MLEDDIKEIVAKGLEVISIDMGADEIPLGIPEETIEYFAPIIAHEIAQIIPEGDESGLLTDEALLQLEIDFNRAACGEHPIVKEGFAKYTAKEQQALTTRLKDKEWQGKVREVEKQIRRDMFKALRMACGIRYYGDKDLFVGIKTPDAVYMTERDDRLKFLKLLFGQSLKSNLEGGE